MLSSKLGCALPSLPPPFALRGASHSPFPFSFVAWLERKVMCPDTPMQEALLMGSVLVLIWASLRWNDGLWSPPGRLVLQSGSTAVTGLAIRTKSCRASMPWGCQLYGLTGGPSACWGLSWLNLMQRALDETSRRFVVRISRNRAMWRRLWDRRARARVLFPRGLTRQVAIRGGRDTRKSGRGRPSNNRLKWPVAGPDAVNDLGLQHRPCYRHGPSLP